MKIREIDGTERFFNREQEAANDQGQPEGFFAPLGSGFSPAPVSALWAARDAQLAGWLAALK